MKSKRSHETHTGFALITPSYGTNSKDDLKFKLTVIELQPIFHTYTHANEYQIDYIPIPSVDSDQKYQLDKKKSWNAAREATD